MSKNKRVKLALKFALKILKFKMSLRDNSGVNIGAIDDSLIGTYEKVLALLKG